MGIFEPCDNIRNPAKILISVAQVWFMWNDNFKVKNVLGW